MRWRGREICGVSEGEMFRLCCAEWLWPSLVVEWGSSVLWHVMGWDVRSMWDVMSAVAAAGSSGGYGVLVEWPACSPSPLLSGRMFRVDGGDRTGHLRAKRSGAGRGNSDSHNDMEMEYNRTTPLPYRYLTSLSTLLGEIAQARTAVCARGNIRVFSPRWLCERVEVKSNRDGSPRCINDIALNKHSIDSLQWSGGQFTPPPH